MGDSELDAIRQRRMQQIMAQQGGAMPWLDQGGKGLSAEQQEEQEEQRRAAEEQRRGMLAALMTNEARERLSRIALVKPDKARSIENMILGAAQRGALQEKVSEERLVSMLEQISEREGAAKPKVTIHRRRPVFDDDD